MKSLLLAFTLLLPPTLNLLGSNGGGSAGEAASSPLEAFYGTKETEKFATHNGTNYVIYFKYQGNICTIPATIPPGCPHWDSDIQVYRLDENQANRSAVGHGFGGQFTDGKCFEDNPDDLIEHALKDEAELKVKESASSQCCTTNGARGTVEMFTCAYAFDMETFRKISKDLTPSQRADIRKILDECDQDVQNRIYQTAGITNITGSCLPGLSSMQDESEAKAGERPLNLKDFQSYTNQVWEENWNRSKKLEDKFASRSAFAILAIGTTLIGIAQIGLIFQVSKLRR